MKACGKHGDGRRHKQSIRTLLPRPAPETTSRRPPTFQRTKLPRLLVVPQTSTEVPPGKAPVRQPSPLAIGRQERILRTASREAARLSGNLVTTSKVPKRRGPSS